MRKIYALEDLDCAVCAGKLETALNKIKGVKSGSVSYMSQKMIVDFEEGVNEEEVMKEIVKMFKKVEPDCSIKR